ncbi:MAG: hypothetical protein MI974_09975 [Chitinophagales bacterium]|nr:hypothetical protein [Chitinophagales bacterium]
MIKFPFLLTLLFLTQITIGQTEYEKVLKSLKKKERKSIQNSEECKEGINKAIIDFQNHKGKYFVVGDLNNWDVTYDWHMNNVLEVETEIAGCVSDYWEYCYNLYSEMKIKEIYGSNIFKRLENETDSLYEIGLGVENSKYDGEEIEFNKYIYCNLELPNSLEEDKMKMDEKISVYLRFNVDSIGEVSNPIVDSVNNTNNKEYYEKESIRIVSEMKNWIPAKRYGKNVKSIEFISIYFDQEKINESCKG